MAVLTSVVAAQSPTRFALDASHTTVKFTLADVLHTVHGTFRLKRGALDLDASSGKLTGEIVVDAKSGDSGSAIRDRKMHGEILESDRWPEIVFRPDRIEGTVAALGTSSVQVHGVFSIHGADHELTVPAEIEMDATHWKAAVHLAVPYVNWGMKNPSTFFLHVSESVDIDLIAEGSVTQP